MPTRRARGRRAGPTRKEAYGSYGSSPSITDRTVAASSTVSANTETQSRLRHAGTPPRADTRPGVGFSPTTLLKRGGTRPDRAVWVRGKRAPPPRATTPADPELEPPLIRSG